MRVRHGIPTRVRNGIGFALLLGLSAALMAFAGHERIAPLAAPASPKLEATIFAFDGQDFIRSQTTLVTDAGQSAVGTKLDRATAAYKALMENHSFTGDATIFGRKYEANYAPLTGADGRVTGALFIGVTK
ncbi:MAG TPA: Cache 3/Cache 2 fusion domain-containing protein [Gemmatimonadales bacterium]|nr:Cache 3/Cache 2 fusion domain-containing protein [Gemmatimonadales bacterium]